MFNATTAREKTMKLGKRCLGKAWYWIKVFIKMEVKDCNYETSYGLGESCTKEVKSKLKSRLEKLGYTVSFADYDSNRIVVKW
jgi:hypothetical protein